MEGHFQEGRAFPAFEFPSVALRDGEKIERVVSNETLRGTPFVLWVYPKDATSGCTLEAREFAALYGQFQSKGVEVLGVSRDTLSSHARFCGAEALPFPLLSDKNGAWLAEHGLIYEAQMYGKPVTKVRRTTFFVDGKGIMRRVWEAVAPEGHAAAVLGSVETGIRRAPLER